MKTEALALPISEEPLLVANVSSVLVLLATDHPRRANTGFSPARATLRTWPLADIEPQWAASMLTAIAALLHRYTDQPQVSLRVSFAAHVHTAHTWAPSLSGATLVSELSGAAKAFLQEYREIGTQAGALNASTTNIAVTLGAQAKSAQSVRSAAQTEAFDVHFFIDGDGSGRGLSVIYNSELFDESTIERLLGHLYTLAAAVSSNPGAQVANLPLLTQDEKSELERSAQQREIRLHELPHLRFEQYARTQPQAHAATDSEQSITYEALNQRANQLARVLRELGAGPDRRVVVCLEPSVLVPIAILGLQKAGAVYVPLDPAYPAARIAVILDDVQPVAIVTQQSVFRSVELGQHQIVCLDGNPELENQKTENLDLHTDPEQAAYVFYTSGSTGKPKGVVATYGNLAQYLGVARDRYDFSPADVFCSVARFTFSISLFELYSPLAAGGELLLTERYDVLDPQRLIQRLERVTVMHAGPSLLRHLFRHLDSSGDRAAFAHMRHISTGGDLVSAEVMEKMKETFPKAEVFVIYGSTEVSCMGCTYPVLRSKLETKTLVGRPFENVLLRLVDPADNMVPIGVVGEILFGGLGITRGYLNRPELNTEKFVEIDGERFYRTGDIGRLDAHGNVEFLGRRDFQIQLNGIRIELVEVEAALRRVRHVREGVAAMRETKNGDKVLVGYFVSDRADLATADIRREMLQELPDHMVPTAFVRLEKLPLNLNMKLDRNALPKDGFMNQTSAGLVQPRNATETRILGMFSQALGGGPLGIHDDFFSLGGHSLLAVQVTNQLQDALGKSVPLSALFEFPTVAELAEFCMGPDAGKHRPIPLNARREGPNLHLLMGIHIYRPLATCLESAYCVKGAYVDSEERLIDSGSPTPGIKELARDYVEGIRADQPHGPYHIAGLSFGGIIAYEVAQQLKGMGETVSMLCMIDAVLPVRNPRLDMLKRAAQIPLGRLYDAISVRVGNRLNPRSDNRETQFRPRDYEDQALVRLDAMRGEAYRQASNRYMSEIKPYDGPAILVVAGRRIESDPFLDPTCGWQRYVRQLETHTFDAHHLELLEPPVVQQVAEVLLRAEASALDA